MRRALPAACPYCAHKTGKKTQKRHLTLFIPHMDTGLVTVTEWPVIASKVNQICVAVPATA